MGPRALEVRPTFRRRRTWPWLAAAVVLLALGLWEIRARRARPGRAPGSAEPASRAPSLAGRREWATPAPARPPAAGEPISGTVVTRDGAPAPGVTVVAAPAGAEARTDAGGRFRLEVERGAPVRLEAHHSDLGFARAEARAPAQDLVLRLEPRAGIEVHVLAEGRPVAGAAVSVQQRGGEAALFHADRPTDGSGSVRVLGLPGGALEVEAVQPETGARSTLPLEAREGTVASVTLLLPAVGVVRGTVVTRSGAPVAGAFVGVEEAEGLPARSGDDGSFVLKGLRTGRDYRLTARTPELSLDVPASARAGQSDVRLVLRERPVYRGRVVGPSGAPLRAFSIDGRPVQAEDGRFAVPLEPRDGQVELRLAAEGMLTRSVQAGAAVSELGDLQLHPGPQLVGRVRLAGGEPAADAVVSAGPDTTRTDPTGSFTLAVSELPAERGKLTVLATKGELAGSAETWLGSPVEVVLSGEQPVRVRVFGPEGTPASGRGVQLAGNRTYSWTTGPDGVVEAKALAGEYRASTDAQPGRVWFLQLPAREVLLGASAGQGSLTVDVDAPLEALWVEKGIREAPLPGEQPGPRGEGQLVFGVERSARFDGLAAGTWTVVGLRQGVPVQQVVQVSGATRITL